MMTPAATICRAGLLAGAALAAAASFAYPIREWNWRMPAEVYRDLEFSDRAGVDRATKFFQQAVDAEGRGAKAPDLVPRYRNAAGEWRKVQVKGEAGELNPSLLAYAVFMQGYSRMQAHDRNEAIRLFEEVCDIYPEQKFIAVPARYMIARVRRDSGDVREANEQLAAIADDPGCEGHQIYYNVLRDRAWDRIWKGDFAGARDDLLRIVYTTKEVDGQLRNGSRGTLVSVRIVLGEFDDLEKDMLACTPDNPRDRRGTLSWYANWFASVNSDDHEISRFLNVKWPREKKASAYKAEREKVKRGFANWFDGEGRVYEGDVDGWGFAFAQVRVHATVDKPSEVLKRVRGLEPLVKGAKGSVRNDRAFSLAGVLADIGLKEAAFAAIDMAADPLFRLRKSSEIADRLNDHKLSVAYLEEYVNTKPGPPPDELLQAKYDLGWRYQVRLGQPEKAVKVYQTMDDPPNSLWCLADAYRASGKKPEAYRTLTEIVSAFPDKAAAATLRFAQWREADGEKEKAIALYRRILSHPKWKETPESSAAHQALERFGVATGGAMTNQVR